MTVKKIAGKVWLVGGGPGDPELLTVKGLRCLKHCDVVIYDALVSPDLLKHCPRKAEKIFVGKRRHRHAFEQNEINTLLLKYVRKGKNICRLKGGDPFLFGRGGEESEFLACHQIPFEVVPGVSSVIAVPAAAGIPLTHRSHASYVAIATGHEDNGEDAEWYRYASKKTLVILMGFHRMTSIVGRLLDSGWPKETAIALICRGTLPDQATVTGTLKDIVKKVEKLKSVLSAPAMIVVGDVVKLREKIFPSVAEIDLLPIDQLKAHEETIPERTKKIKDEIEQSGQLESALWVEKKSKVILNGHHRLAALKLLGCEFVPCILLDYSSPEIKVGICPGSSVTAIDKSLVLQAALGEKLFPPRSSLHVLRFDPPDFSVPLEMLRSLTVAL